ncbi:hypothetical protein BH20ACT2_BH20ACT2_20920 [soil metagenome]
MTAGPPPAAPLAAPPRPPPIDPRIRARRIAVRRDEGRRRRLRLVGAGIVAALVGVALGLTRTPLLDIDQVRVHGVDGSEADTVLAASGVRRGDPLTDLDPGAAARRVEELPWVADVTVRRRWPATVELDVVERVVVAQVPAAGGGWRLVDPDGHLIGSVATPRPEVVRLVGIAPGGEPGTVLAADAAGALRVAAALPPDVAARIAAVLVLDDGGVELELVPAGTAILGRVGGRALGAKLTALVAVLDGVALTAVCTVDVRVPEAPVLTSGAECA